MLRKLLVCACLCSTAKATAQVSLTPVKTTEKQVNEIDYTQSGAPMPPLRIIIQPDTAGKANAAPQHRKKANKHIAAKPVMTEKDFDNQHNLFVMLFNPNCSHCEDVTLLLGQHIKLFKKSNIVLLAAPSMKLNLGDFVSILHTGRFPGMYVGLDSAGFIKNTLLYKQLPQINIYDKHRKLIKTFSGEVTIDSLQAYIQ